MSQFAAEENKTTKDESSQVSLNTPNYTSGTFSALCPLQLFVLN